MSEIIPTVLAVWLLLVIGVAVAITRMLRAAAERRLRFSLMTMLHLVTCLALVAGGWAWLRQQYYWQLNAVNTVFDEQPDLRLIQLATSRDYRLHVRHVYFCFNSAGHVTGDFDVPYYADEDEIRERLLSAMKPLAPFAAGYSEARNKGFSAQ